MRALTLALLLFLFPPGRFPAAAPVQGKHSQLVFFPLDPTPAKHARVELLSLQSEVDPGAKLLVGVHFVLDKGWHIYWVNPGDSGQPPSFQWHLPPGYTAGDIQWPRPERMQSSPELADYGYHDDVLLMVPIQSSRDIEVDGQGVGFSVDAKWLICREICLPDHAELRGQWGTGDVNHTNQATAALFAKAQELLPKPWPSWELFAKSGKDTFLLVLGTLPLGLGNSRVPSGTPQFFPLEPGQVENAARQSVQYIPDGINITLKKSDLLLKPISVLRGVLVFPDGEAFQIEVPVVSAEGIK